jgi:hypothetical protein
VHLDFGILALALATGYLGAAIKNKEAKDNAKIRSC